MQIKIVDASRVEEGAEGLYIEMEEVVVRRSLNRYGERQRTTFCVRIPARYADEVGEAKKLGQRIEISYDDTRFGNPADFIRVIT